MKTIKIITKSTKDIIAKINVDCIKDVSNGVNGDIVITGKNINIAISDVYIRFNNTTLGKILAETISDILNIKISIIDEDIYNIPFSYEDYSITINDETGDIIIYKYDKKIIKTTIEE